MVMAVSHASAVWEGDLVGGSGRVSVASGAFPEQSVTWAARTERPDPKTSPEELISAAHAACYAMALSGTLAGAGHPPEQLSVDAVTHFTPLEGGGFGITRIDLAVRGRVAGVDQAEFEQLADEGERGCPVSNALRGNVEIRVKATLEA
jgi:lipoyl-dependent peroxiredoxin